MKRRTKNVILRVFSQMMRIFLKNIRMFSAIMRKMV